MTGFRASTNPPRPAAHRQGGAALVVGLIFLVLMTLLGVTAFGINVLEERMAGHTRDRTLAFQAAEAALRECEARGSTVSQGPFKAARWAPIRPAAGADRTDWDAAWGSDGRGGGSTALATGTIPDVSGQPRCIVEETGQRVTCPGNESLGTGGAINDAMLYRVTARGYGVSGQTLVVLQSVFYNCN